MQRRGGEQYFAPVFQRPAQALAHLVAGAVGVAELVRFVNHHHIPWHGADVRLHGAGEIEGGDDDAIGQKWRGVAVCLGAPVGDGIQNRRRQVEFFLQLQTPLLADGRRANHKQAAPPFGPKLAEDQRGFDGFAEADLIGQHDALAQRAISGRTGRRQSGAD